MTAESRADILGCTGEKQFFNRTETMKNDKESKIAAIKDRLSWIYLIGDTSNDALREVEELRQKLRLLTTETPNTGPNHDYVG